MMQEAFLPLPAPPPSNRHTLGCRSCLSRSHVVAHSSISSTLLPPNSLFLKIVQLIVVVDKSFELLRGVESLSCPSGLCVCLPSCLQRRCDPVLACHLSCLLPSHLCICHSPSCPYGKIPLSHWALTYLLLTSATTGSHSKVFVFQGEGCACIELMLGR